MGWLLLADRKLGIGWAGLGGECAGNVWACHGVGSAWAGLVMSGLSMGRYRHEPGVETGWTYAGQAARLGWPAWRACVCAGPEPSLP
jgi:hypothetical protein